MCARVRLFFFSTPHQHCTGWRRLIGSSKLQIIFHKRATKYRPLLPKMTYKDKGSYESSPPCANEKTYYTKVNTDKRTHPHTHTHMAHRKDIHYFVFMYCPSLLLSLSPSLSHTRLSLSLALSLPLPLTHQTTHYVPSERNRTGEPPRRSVRDCRTLQQRIAQACPKSQFQEEWSDKVSTSDNRVGHPLQERLVLPVFRVFFWHVLVNGGEGFWASFWVFQ